MPVLDTSFLLALFDPDDDHHAGALRLARDPGPFVVPAVILSEFLAVVSFRTRKLVGHAAASRETRALLDNIVAQPAFQIEAEYDLAAAWQLFSDHQALSYPDAVALAVAKTAGERPLTFDAAQATVAKRM